MIPGVPEDYPAERVARTRESWDRLSVQMTPDPAPLLGVVSPPEQIVLDPTSDFERALIDMVKTARKKRADYASDSDEFSNFRDQADFAGFESPALAALYQVVSKLTRIKALRKNGRMAETANEAVDDTFLDIAVYAVLAHAMWLRDSPAKQEQAYQAWADELAAESGKHSDAGEH